MPIRVAIATGCLLLAVGVVSAQTLPPCGWERPAFTDEPWAGEGNLWCVERVLDDGNLGAIGVAHIAPAPDGSVYATVPMHGQVLHMTDTNGDTLPDTSRVLLADLTRPVGIVYHEGGLFIAGNQHLYRYDIAAEVLGVLANDLPWGWTGYPTGGVTIHDEHIYVAVGGDDACTPGRGTIHRFALDGSGREVFATGLRSPADIAYYGGALWAVDTATDRLVQVQAGADYSACSGTTPPDVPTYTFAPGSEPVALAPYTHTLHTPLTDTLLVALRGTEGTVIVEGYEVVAVTFDDTGTPDGERPVLPVLPGNLNLSEQKMHIQESGFYPHHVYGVMADANGWIYIAAGAGQVYALRGL